ncbi:MAG: hypothetical protein K0R57_1580 [Paenibacillaceae bacterium]|jgi:hypothetical protein|nr:hypothetical protein [Paenibacillaceae bacterium]
MKKRKRLFLLILLTLASIPVSFYIKHQII